MKIVGNNSVKTISLILGGILSLSAIFGGLYAGLVSVDSWYARADEFYQLRSEFDEKQLRDEIFNLKLLLVQENLYSGNQETRSTIWMSEELKIKEAKLKTLLTKGD